MTNGSQAQLMAETPRSTSSSLTIFIDDDPTLPRLTMTNGILVPVTDGSEETSDSGPVPCQYYTVTSFCQNPNHLDLNYANQHQFHWNNTGSTLDTFVVKQKPREIIHKIHYEGEEETVPITRQFLNQQQENNSINKKMEKLKGQINHSINFIRNNRACSMVNLTLEPIKPINNINGDMIVNIKPRLSQVKSLISDINDSTSELRILSSPEPSQETIPVVPPRNRNKPLSSFSSQSKESIEFQGAPPTGNFMGNPQKRKSVSGMIDVKAELLASQFQKKEKLRLAVESKQTDLSNLKREVQYLQKQLEPLLRIEKLKKNNERLQHECKLMTSEVDSYTDGSIPLGETNAEFYRERSPRQDANPLVSNPSTPTSSRGTTSISRNPMGRLPTGTHHLINRKVPPPRPPPPSSLRIPWDCTKCTFRNHPELTTCEQCEMIRVLPSPSATSSPPGSQGQETPSPPPYYYHQQPRSAP